MTSATSTCKAMQHVSDIQYLFQYYGHTFLLYDQPRRRKRDISIQHRGNPSFDAEVGYVQNSPGDMTKIDLVLTLTFGDYESYRLSE